VVMQGFLHLKMPQWQRALLTRALAIGPALVAVAMFGERGSTQLLVASQVVLSMQLPLAVIPLVRFAGDRALMGQWRIGGVMQMLAWVSVGIIVVLNAALMWQVMSGWK
jgi:manganese transport protein